MKRAIKSPLRALVWTVLIALLAPLVVAQDAKPNVLIIWGDDIGTWN